MKPKIFISAPMTVPTVHLCEVEDLLNEKYEIPYSHISYWDRKSAYDQKEFESADAVVFILNDYAFEGKEGSIPIGVDYELRRAIEQGKHTFLAYKLKSTGVIKFYTFRCGWGLPYKTTWIKALSDTYHVFDKFVKDFKPNEDLKPEPKQDFFIDQKEREEELRKWAELHIKLAQNSTYGAFGELDHTSKFEQVKFPEVHKVYATAIPNPDYVDPRLLFLL